MKKFLVGIIVAFILLSWLIARVNLTMLRDSLLAVSFPMLIGALGIKVAVIYVKARRWGLAIAGRPGKASFQCIFPACVIGFAGNVVMPARLGELARIVVFSEHNRISRSLALTSLAVTQIFDLLILALCFLAVSFWTAGIHLVDRRALVILVIATIVLFLSLAVVQWRPQRIRSALLIAERFSPTSMQPRLRAYVKSVRAGLKVIHNPSIVALLSVSTLLIWSMEMVAMMLALVAFGVAADPIVSPLMVVALNLSFAVPLTPGNVGIHQLVSVWVLSRFDVAEVDALAFSIGYQGTVNLMIVLMGGAFFYREGISFRWLSSKARVTSGSEDP